MIIIVVITTRSVDLLTHFMVEDLDFAFHITIHVVLERHFLRSFRKV